MEKTIAQKMLERIVLINSSTFQYAEVFVDGNTHIAGDNSVGKSTFLQIATLFYTGDPSRSKLGIGDGKLPFQQYHLQHPFSYIVYEVRRSEAPGDRFMVVLKNSNWPTFTFFDCPFSREIFFDENQAAYDNLENVKNAARRLHGNLDIRSIKGAKEYLGILYGWRSGQAARDRSLEKFSLTSCPGTSDRPHEKIAALLQMLLNLGKVQGDVLKKMIVSSLESTSQPFNVNTHRDQAHELFKDYHAIRTWTSDPALIQAQERFVKAYRGYCDEKEAYSLYPAQAKYARRQAEESLLETTKERDALLTEYDSLKARINSRREETHGTIQAMTGRQSVLEDNLKKTEEKHAEFASFLQLIPLIESEDELKKDWEHANGLLRSITREADTLKRDFDARKDALDNEFTIASAQNDAEKARLSAKAAQYKKDFADILELERSEQEALFKSTREALDINRNEASAVVSSLEKELIVLKTFKPKESEIETAKKRMEEIKQEIDSLEKDSHRLDHEIGLAEEALKHITDKVRLERSGRKHAIEEDIRRLTERRDVQMRKIDSYAGSLAEWLDGKVERWSRSVGKVVSEEVLLRKDLSPEWTGADGDTVYGVKLDLDPLSPAGTTPALLKEDLDTILRQLETAEKEQKAEKELTDRLISEQTDTAEKDIEPKREAIKGIGKSVSSKKEEQSTLETLIASLKTEQDRVREERISQKKAEKVHADNILAEAIAALENAEREFEDYKKTLSEKKRSREKEIDIAVSAAILELEDKAKEAENVLEQRKAEIDAALAEALSEKGIAPKRVVELQTRLQVLEKDLKKIENNKNRYYSYLAAKEGYFDHEADWKDELVRLRNNIAKTKENDEILSRDEDRQLQEKDNDIQGLNESIDESKEDIRIVDGHFLESRKDEYNSCEPLETEYRARVIVDNDSHSLEKIAASQEAMEASWLRFGKMLGDHGLKKFFPASANCLDIKTDSRAQDDVNEFITERIISDHILAWNTHAVPFVSEIFYSASNFKKDIDSIKDIVRDLNKTFRDNNFTDVIKRFELSVEEIGTELISLIHSSSAIHRDYCEDADQGRNLLDGSSRNKRFIGYIQDLANKLETYGHETIQIEDMFTLYIEADEGMNKSGRKKEIRELGSNGIDTIFKNILYLLMIQNIRKRFGRHGNTFMIHCPVDEQASLSPSNFNNLMELANRLGIFILANSPMMPIGTEESFKRAYRFSRKPGSDFTKADLLLTWR